MAFEGKHLDVMDKGCCRSLGHFSSQQGGESLCVRTIIHRHGGKIKKVGRWDEMACPRARTRQTTTSFLSKRR
jgi:hypothetical protein